jgi:CubicO group peptidase (beta-lactamase class C family)
MGSRPADVSRANASDDAAALNQFIQSAQQTYQVPGVAVAVVHNDQVVLQQGYGVRCLGGSDPVDANTVYQLASNSKPFTAAVLGTLVDAGKLDWDDPVTEHLPGFALDDAYATRYATTRDLLAMRTGLPAFTGDLLGHEGYSRDEVLQQVRALPLAHSFREVAAYSNVGYFVAGQEAANLADTTWNDAVQSRLLAPLGMTRSGTSRADRPIDGNWSCNHDELDGVLQPVDWADSDVFGAAGGVTSSAADMARWMRMLLNGGTLDGHQVLTEATAHSLFVPSMVAARSFTELPPISSETGFGYALGWGTYYFQGHQVLEKGGALDGVRTVTVLVPDINLGVSVLSNRNLTPLPEAIRAFVLNQYLGGAGADTQAQILKANASLETLLAPAAPPAQPEPPTAPLAAYAGTYVSPVYGSFVLSPGGDGSEINPAYHTLVPDSDGPGLGVAAGPGQYRGTLSHVSRDTFLLTWQSLTEGSEEVTFTLGPTGQVTEIHTQTLGTLRPAEQAPAIP